jgi:DNA mismatch repair protein MutL
VDVNIHPAKREVKFHREKVVRQLLTQAIKETLLAFHAPARGAVAPAVHGAPAEALRATLGFPSSPPDTGPAQKQGGAAWKPHESLPPNPFPKLEYPVKTDQFPLLATSQSPAPPALADPLGVDFVKSIFQTARPEVASPGREPAVAPPPATAAPLLQVPLRLVGVIGRLYVVLESDRGLVLLDQHAAHERVLFEQMLRRLEQTGSAPSQRLLLPETVELPVREAQFLRGQLPQLTRLGVGLSEFGERTFLLDALPPFVKAGHPRQFILTLLDELKAAGQMVNTLRLGEQVVAKTVCRHAVKANDPLAGPELENLIQDLRHCAMPYTCPHGRPTLIEMNFRELEKKFGRVS